MSQAKTNPANEAENQYMNMRQSSFFAVVAAEIIGELWHVRSRPPGFEENDIRRANTSVAAGIVFG